MDGAWIGGFVVSLAILAVITLVEMRRWLPAKGWLKFMLVFLAGAAIVGSLYTTGIPPDWFDGGKEGFGLAVMLLLGGWVAEREPGRTFALPLTAGMSAALFVLNVMPHF